MDLSSFFRNKRNLTNFLVVLLIVVALPATVYLVRQQQTLRSKAAAGTIEILDGPLITRGNPTRVSLNDLGRAIVPLRLTSPFGPPLANQTPLPTQPPATQPPATQPPSGADSDNDGDPNSTDCGPNDARAHHGQTKFFGTPFTNASGQSSYDFNCDGIATKNPANNCTTTLPLVSSCSATKPAGIVGYIGSVPACGTGGTIRYCESFLRSSCTQEPGAPLIASRCNVCYGGPPDFSAYTFWDTYDNPGEIVTPMDCH